tara:strand:- start:135 stop:449 length:315 start_codon:yes stop_codon:yes gene_type:complete
MDDLKTPSFFIIALLGTIVTFGFFLVFLPRIFKKQINPESTKYVIIVFDVYGKKTMLNGIRTNFRNKDVALSFAKFYKKKFPLYDFRIINEFDGTERLVIVEHV